MLGLFCGCSIREVRTRCRKEDYKKGTQESKIVVGEEGENKSSSLSFSCPRLHLDPLSREKLTFSHRGNKALGLYQSTGHRSGCSFERGGGWARTLNTAKGDIIAM